MINNVRNTVLTVLNKENRGYLTPEQFNSYARYAQQNIFNQYFSEYASMVSLKNARRLGADQGDRVRELKARIDPFTVVATISQASGVYPKPANFFKPIAITYGTTLIEEVSVTKDLYLSLANLNGPSATYPTCVDKDNGYLIRPTALAGDISLVYVKNPSEPKWTYQTIGEDPVFNPSAGDYKDFELGADAEVELVLEICKLAGITIREADITQAAIGIDAQNTQKNN